MLALVAGRGGGGRMEEVDSFTLAYHSLSGRRLDIDRKQLTQNKPTNQLSVLTPELTMGALA